MIRPILDLRQFGRLAMRPVVACLAFSLLGVGAFGNQDPETLIIRPGPPSLDDFETDDDDDGVPDGWYNLRDASIHSEGGVVGPSFLRFEADRPSRPSRISRGFGIDGRRTSALVIGLWVRRVGDPFLPGERIGEEPAALFDLLDDDLRTTARFRLGPWSDLPEGRWVRWVGRFAVPPNTRDVLMTVGLLGATGTLDIDGLTIEEVPIGGVSTTNLAVNGDFLLGGLTPDHWIVEGNARRVHPVGHSSGTVELAEVGDRVLAPLGLPVRDLNRLVIAIRARGEGLRGAGGAQAVVYFLTDNGLPIPGVGSAARAVRWAGSFPTRIDRSTIPVPATATRAVLQLEKTDRRGRLVIDSVEVLGEGIIAGGARTWTPFNIDDGGDSWPAYVPVEAIEEGSALDRSQQLESPAGAHGFVQSKEGRLQFEDGTPARFFGVFLLPPLAFAPADRVDALADRLARSGVNLVNLGGLDSPLGPGGSLFDDAASDTSTLDPLSLADFDYFIAAMKRRGIYVALTLQGQARFRSGDGIVDGRALPPGGGPAAAFDPAIRDRAVKVAEALLTRVNPETGLALRDDPVLAWISLAGELSLFDLIDQPDRLPAGQAKALRERSQGQRLGGGRAFWQATEAAQWSSLAKSLRSIGVRVPIAGSAHFRREPEFVEAQRAEGLDLIDDSLFWAPPRFAAPERRTLLRRPSAELIAMADRKRDRERPYVVGQYASYTDGAWALPFEGPDLLFASVLAKVSGWDALVRRGIASQPEIWGASTSGNGGGRDIFVLPEIINGNPQVFSLLPHASALYLEETGKEARAELPGTWDRRTGRLTINTPHSIGVAGEIEGARVTRDGLSIRSESPMGAIVASTVGGEDIADSERLLVTTVARVRATGLLWVDQNLREVADHGRPPLRVEPIHGSITWNRDTPVTAFALDNAGRRIAEINGVRTADGLRFVLDSRDGIIHWELVAKSP